MFVIADSAFAYMTATGSYTSGDNPLTLGWLLGFVLIGEAALRDRTSSEAEPTDATRTASNLSLLLPYLLAAVGVTVAVWEQVRPRLSDQPTLYVAAGLVAVLLARELILLVDNRSLLARVIDQDLELRRQVEILADRALHDALTGLANRAMFYDQLNRAVALHRRDNRPLSILMCDLDDFKSINDTLGHPAGDELLVWVAERFQAANRAGDLVARLGGDEFVILVEDGGDPYRLAARIRGVLAEKATIAGQQIAVTVSIGISQLQPGSATDAEDLIIQADLAMYEDKRRGEGPRNQDQPIRHDAEGAPFSGDDARVFEARRRLTGRLGRRPTGAELAAELGLDEDKITEILRRALPRASAAGVGAWRTAVSDFTPIPVALRMIQDQLSELSERLADLVERVERQDDP